MTHFNKPMLLVTMLSCSGLLVVAQNINPEGLPLRTDYNTWYVGVSGGPVIFQGDLNPKILEDSKADIAFGLSIGKNFSHAFGLKAQGVIGTLSGELLDSKKKKSLQSFEAPYKEGILMAQFTFGNISFLKRKQNLNLYASAGAGMINYETEVRSTVNDTLIKKQKELTEFVLPVSVGLKYRLTNNIHTALEISYRKTLTDKIDGFDRPLTEFDGYTWMNLGITYTIGKQTKAIEWANPLITLYAEMADVKGKMELLSKDQDGDGVADMFDKDQSTPQDAKVYGDGTTVDTDGDGIPDYMDDEPFTPKGARITDKGKAIDTDGDGVADHLDLEPNTPVGNLVNFQGISISKAGDVSSTSTSAISINQIPSVFFELGSSTVSAKYYDRLTQVARIMKLNPDLKVNISGNCDRSGSESLNMKLGQSRADNVKNHLVKVYNIDASRLSTLSKGENEPFAKGIDSQNRRVDFTAVK